MSVSTSAANGSFYNCILPSGGCSGSSPGHSTKQWQGPWAPYDPMPNDPENPPEVVPDDFMPYCPSGSVPIPSGTSVKTFIPRK